MLRVPRSARTSHSAAQSAIGRGYAQPPALRIQLLAIVDDAWATVAGTPRVRETPRLISHKAWVQVQSWSMRSSGGAMPSRPAHACGDC